MPGQADTLAQATAAATTPRVTASGQLLFSFMDEGATLGQATTTQYKATLFAAHPELKEHVVVHHAVEQQSLRLYSNQMTQAGIHSLENLRGIPTALNSELHLGAIRREWNRFYVAKPNATLAELLQKAAEIDAKYGSRFHPPVGGGQ